MSDLFEAVKESLIETLDEMKAEMSSETTCVYPFCLNFLDGMVGTFEALDEKYGITLMHTYGVEYTDLYQQVKIAKHKLSKWRANEKNNCTGTSTR